MYGVSYACVYLAEQHLSSALTAVLFGAFPFFVALLTRIRYGTERLSGLGWMGMSVGFGGVVLISYDSLQATGNLFLGTLPVVGAAFAAAWGVVIHKRYFANENIVVTASLQMVFGGLLLVPAALLLESWSEFHMSVEAVGSIIYLAVLGTVVTFLGYYWLLIRMRAVSVSLIAFVTPLVAILIGATLGGESLSAPVIGGTAMILSGVLLVIKKRE